MRWVGQYWRDEREGVADGQECQEHRQRVVDLMYPSLTGMWRSFPPDFFADDLRNGSRKLIRRQLSAWLWHSWTQSLAFPLYFASRGYGHIRPRRRNPHETSNDTDIDAAEDLEPCSVAHTANADDAELEEYNVTAKVYLSGLGADE